MKISRNICCACDRSIGRSLSQSRYVLGCWAHAPRRPKVLSYSVYEVVVVVDEVVVVEVAADVVGVSLEEEELDGAPSGRAPMAAGFMLGYSCCILAGDIRKPGGGGAGGSAKNPAGGTAPMAGM
mgnify:CR=1 FL=1